MRDIGYSLESALADIVDNSISAGAGTIHIHVDSSQSHCRIGIIDDGCGMSKDELRESMRLGSRNPLEARAELDLGRFGLGLKTASFSQCRRLTVVARKAGETSVAIWDLDYVAEKDSWALQMPETEIGIPFADRLGSEGVLVLWEQLDRAFEQKGSASALKDLVRRIDEARAHLELVFHRFLSGEKGLSRVNILMNNRALEPFDPFHSDHPATMKREPEVVRLGAQRITIQAFTLPYHRNVTTAEYEKYAGPAGYVKNQGFYLYRSKRLIIHGTWFGLARQMELTKLARVRIDMPNDLDSSWKIDVKKASAKPPLQVRERLLRIIDQIGAPSKAVFVKRGTRLHDASLPVWHRLQQDDQIIYRINPDNPLVTEFASGLPANLRASFNRMINVVESAIPMDAIFADLAGHPEAVQNEALADKELAHMVSVTNSALAARGHTQEVIAELMRVVEPFRSSWDRVESILAHISEVDPNDE
jgi:hypothetical protein